MQNIESQKPCNRYLILSSHFIDVFSFPFLQFQIKESKMKVIEGDPSQFISVQSNLPPYLFCNTTTTATINSTDNTSDCTLQIRPWLASHKEFQCGTESIPQAVFGAHINSDGKYEGCMYTITDLNWNKVLKIPVVATLDGLRDETQKRTVMFSSYLVVNGTVELEKELGSVDVSFALAAVYLILLSLITFNYFSI